MANEIKTIEDLAVMIQRTMANKTDFERLEKKVDGNFKEVLKRLSKIEDVLLESHNNRITQLENDVKELRELLKV